MANKKPKKKPNDDDKPKRQISKQEKEMFSVGICAHDRSGNPVDWALIKSLWSI